MMQKCAGTREEQVPWRRVTASSSVPVAQIVSGLHRTYELNNCHLLFTRNEIESQRDWVTCLSQEPGLQLWTLHPLPVWLQ